MVFKIGETAEYFYIIESGKVRLEVDSPSKPSVKIWTLRYHDILGCSWLFKPYNWQFNAHAIEDTEMLLIDAKTIREKCEEDYRLGYELMRCFSQIMMQRMMATRMKLIEQ